MANLIRSLHIGPVFATQDHVGIKHLFLDEYGSFVMAGCAGG